MSKRESPSTRPTSSNEPTRKRPRSEDTDDDDDENDNVLQLADSQQVLGPTGAASLSYQGFQNFYESPIQSFASPNPPYTSSEASFLVPGPSHVYESPGPSYPTPTTSYTQFDMAYAMPGPSGMQRYIPSDSSTQSSLDLSPTGTPRPVSMHPNPSSICHESAEGFPVIYYDMIPGWPEQDSPSVHSYRVHRSRAEDRPITLQDVTKADASTNVPEQPGCYVDRSESVESMDVDDPDVREVESSSSIEREEKSKRLDWTGSPI